MVIRADLMAPSPSFYVLWHDGTSRVRQVILIMLQIVHLDLADVSTSDGLPVFHDSSALGNREG